MLSELDKVRMLLPGLSFRKQCLHALYGLGNLTDFRASGRTRAAVWLAVQLLPAEHRARYREEYAAELADIDRRGQGAYGCRLVTRSWAQRRALRGKARQSTTISVAVTAPSAGIAAALITAVATGTTAIFFAIMAFAGIGFTGWILISPERTARAVDLITAIRHPAARQEHKPPD